MKTNNEAQQLFFASVAIGDHSKLVQFDCKLNQKSKHSMQKICHDIISLKQVLASPRDIICKAHQIEEVKQLASTFQLQLKQSKVDPWVIESSVLSYIRVQLQVRGWNRLSGLLLKGDLFAQVPTNLPACNMDMNVLQDIMTISVAHPHSVRYRPLNLSTISDNQLPPAQCIVLPTMSPGFIAKIYKSPPLTKSLFRSEEDFKSYWQSAHSILLPPIVAYVQVRLGELELTYPSCCLWESKLTEVRSHSADTSQVVTQLIDDMKDIQLFSNALLQFKETPTPIAPKVEWVKSSAMLKSTPSITDLPNIEPMTAKPTVSRPAMQTTPSPTPTTTFPTPIPTSTEKALANNIEKNKPINSSPKFLQKDNKSKEAAAEDATRKKTLGPKKRKAAPSMNTTKPKADTTKGKEAHDINKVNTEQSKKVTTEPNEDEGPTKDNFDVQGPSSVAIDDVLAFDDILEGNKTTDKHESNHKTAPSSELPQQTSKRHTRDGETTTKNKRSKVESLSARTVAELQAYCRREKLKISGTKPDLVTRVREFLERQH